MATHTFTGDLGNLVDADLTSPNGTRARAYLNPQGGEVTSGSDTLIGSAELTLDVDDAFSIVAPEGSYYLSVRYWDPVQRQMTDWTSPAFFLDADKDLIAVVEEDAAVFVPTRGAIDHGNVSGTVTLDAAYGMHEMNLTGGTVLAPSGPIGSEMAVKVTQTGTGNNLTLSGAGFEGAGLVIPGSIVFIRYATSGWRAYAVNATDLIPDTTAPTAPSLSVDNSGAFQLVATFSGGTDAVGVTQYRSRIDAGAWSVVASPRVFSGLSPSTAHTIDVQAGDAANNWSTSTSFSGSTAAASIPSGAYDDAVLADSPYQYLSLGDTVGTTVPTHAGSGTETWSAANVTFGAAGVGDGTTSADFNGTTSRITASVAFPGAVSAITVEALVTPDAVNGRREIYGKQIQQWLLCINAGKVEGYTGNTAGFFVTGATTLVVATRYHLAMVYNGTDIRVYVNGALDGTQPRTGTISASGTGTWIGNSNLGLYDGKMAGCAFYLSALSAARILAHAQAAGLA